MQLHESDAGGGRRSTFGRGVRLQRFSLGEDVDVCICAYRATVGSRWRGVSNRLELGVQLSGTLAQRSGARSDVRRYEARSIHVLSPGEAYDVSYAADARPGVAVWFSIDADRWCADRDRELRGTADGEPDRDLEDAARLVCEDAGDRSWIAPHVRSVLATYVRRRCELSRSDGVVTARRFLEEYFDRDLYLRHLAEAAGLRPTTLLRRFARRYGVTPIQYRIRTRLNRADRLGWTRPELGVAEIAQACGFPNLSYFYRQFTAYFGTTPAEHRRNDAAIARALDRRA